MADAGLADVQTIFILKVICSANNNVLQNAIAFPSDANSFQQLFDHFLTMNKHRNTLLSNINLDNVNKIVIKDNVNASGIEVSDFTMSVSLSKELNSKFIEFYVSIDDESKDPLEPCKPNANAKNAFTFMMESRTKLGMPPKPSEKLTGPQKLYADIISWVSEFDDGWTPSMIDSGKKVLGKLSNCLWYIDHNHEKFDRKGCPIPAVFQKFRNYNNFSKHHHTRPVISRDKLNQHCIELAKCLSLPSMTTAAHKTLYAHIDALLFSLVKYRDSLDQDNKRQQTIYQVRKEPARNAVTDSTCLFIKPSNAKVDSIYADLDSLLTNIDQYTIVDLDQFSPNDHIKRRKYIQNLALSVPIMMYRMAYGGSIGTLTFIWTVPEDDSPARSERNNIVIAQIVSQLPRYSTRAMRRDFINKYTRHVKAPKALLRHMFFDLTGTESISENATETEVNDRVAQILEGDDPQLLIDYRSLNGRKVEEKYDDFFAEMSKYFNEQNLQVHERRHGNELYLPYAVSVEDLKEQIIQRLPQNVPVPSTELIRLQFMPSNPFCRTSLKFTGRFNVKFQVQTRQARVFHPDGRYVSTLFKYLKEFCVDFRDNCLFVCLDDKAIIPVGEPGVHISSGVRSHNRVIGPADGASLVAADHDFHVGGIVPSVTLVTDIPQTADDSFFGGKVYITSKDKVFEASSPFRHATELIKILRNHHSNNNVDLQNPILCIMTDGGPDHRLTYETVKASLVQVFMQLDLDMLIAIRTAPNHSWLNPAERCMSILNLALQHVALARDPMPETFENRIKHKATLNAVRSVAESKKELKEAFSKSMDSVIKTVNERFERMKLKGSKFTVYRGASEQDIEDSLDILRNTTGAENLKRFSNSKDVKGFKDLQNFITVHGKSTQYSFQLRKCLNQTPCAYCALNPVRVPDPDILQWLPCPVPDETGQHYQSFRELFGREVDDSHRPSGKNTTGFEDMDIEFDKQNRETFKAVKIRDAIHCGECQKPRLIFSPCKLTREQEDQLRRMKEERMYVCGSNMPLDCGFLTRRCLSCTSEVEIGYYSASVHTYLPPCCIYCGDQEDLLDDCNEYIEKLYEDFSVVRPLCKWCREKGLEAKTWGKKFFKKKRT